MLISEGAGLDDPAQEERWIREARRGCREAFGRLLARHEASLFAFVRKSLQCDPDTAADITQETFETACTRLHRFRGDSRFRTWLTGIAVNRIRNWRRRQRFRELLGMEAIMETQVAGRQDCPAHQAEIRDDWERMESAFQTLSPVQREALYLREVANFSHEEIAESLTLNRNTVKSRIHSARQAMLRYYRHDTVD